MKDAKLMPVDSPNPTWVQGLPRGMEIKLISCGSHHTSFLMEDNSVYAIGIATDSAEPLGETAVQIVPPGLINSPITQFSSHFDRTTIVAGDGGKEQQVLEMQMWSTEDLRSAAVFEPEWLETLTRDESRVEVVERGWMHTVVLTSS
jgi:alpha-tubulin suppressor-like RCC1 family protein